MKRFLRIYRDYGFSILKFALATKVLTPLTRFFGLYVLTDHFYHPIPDRKTLLGNARTKRALWSIEWNEAAQNKLLQQLIDTYKREFNDSDVIGKYGYRNEAYSIGTGDAEILYAMVRLKKPQRIVEIGAGGSTRIMLAALDKNIEETGTTPQLVTIDPSPLPFLDEIAKDHELKVDFEVKRGLVQQVDLSVFSALQENDILFVDSSHVYKQGSDVEHEFLHVYPSLNVGVVVHIHDIFFPFDYPIEWNTREYYFWNEQYYLEMLLQHSNRFRVLLSLFMMVNEDKHRFVDNIDDFHEARGAGSFWMQRV